MSVEVMNMGASGTATPAAPAPAAPAPAAAPDPKATGVEPKPEGEKTDDKDKEPGKEKDKLSGKFAALAREERRIQTEREAVKKERAEFQSSPEYKEFKEFKDAKASAKVDPLRYLESLGWNYAELTKHILNDKKLTPEQRVQQLEERLSAKEKAEKDAADAKAKESEEAEIKAQQEKVESQISQFVSEIGDFLDKNPDAYELTKNHPEGKELVYNVIEQHFQKHERILSTEEAAQAVESWLEEETEKFTKLKKVQSKLSPKAPEDPASPKAPAAPTAPKTLTNSLETEVPTPTNRKLSVEESKENAKKLLRWR